jgi:hypothetical protein
MGKWRSWMGWSYPWNAVMVPAAAATKGSREGTLDLDDEFLGCGQLGPEHTRIGNVEWDSNRRLIAHMSSLLSGSGNVRGMTAPAGPSGKTTLSRDTHQTAPQSTPLVKFAVHPERGEGNTRRVCYDRRSGVAATLLYGEDPVGSMAVSCRAPITYPIWSPLVNNCQSSSRD